MSHIDKRSMRRVIYIGESYNSRYTARLIHHGKHNALELEIRDKNDGREIWFETLKISGELFAAYRALADVTKAELERLNAEFAGGGM